MISVDPAQQLSELIASGISVESVGTDRVEVSLPFIFDDGDQISFYAVREAGGAWRLTDDGDVLQRLQDSGQGPTTSSQEDRLTALIEFYGVSSDRGHLGLRSTTKSLADDLFLFAQTCLEAAWLGKSNRFNRKASTRPQFQARIRSLIDSVTATENVTPKWHDPQSDPKRLYPVDYRILGKQEQLFLFGVASEMSCALATIACQHYRSIGTDFRGVVIYEDETDIRPRYADRLNEAVDQRFPNIGQYRTITQYLASAAA